MQTTTFTVQRAQPGRCGSGKHRHTCTKFRSVASFAHKDNPGKVSIPFVKAKTLAAGRYRLQATPRAGNAKGKTVNTTFTIE